MASADWSGDDMTPPANTGGSIETRVSHMESTLDGLVSDVQQIKTAVMSKQVPWGTIFAGLMLVGAVYAAAIAPIKEEQARQSQTDAGLRSDVAANEAHMVKLERELATLTERLETVRRSAEELRALGSPPTRERLRILESKVGIKSPADQ